MSKKVIGIDLGTGNSAVSVIEAGKPVIVANSEGKRTTPSVVFIKDGEREVGGAAQRKLIIETKNTINFVKRFMGADWNDKDVQTMIKQVGYDVVNVDGKPRICIDGRNYSAEEISSYILTYMKKTAEDYLGTEVNDAIVTCPAWYDSKARQSVKTAGELAGLNVLRVINEPTAAILAADIKVKDGDTKTVLVSDLGAGTTDFSLCEVSDIDGQIMVEVIASYGDVFLGGQNIDNAIVDWICDEFKKEDGVDLRKDKLAYPRIVEAAEKAKCELSSSTQTDITLPYITVKDGTPLMLTMTLTRAKFDQITDFLADKMVDCGVKCLEKANKTADDLDEVLLVGGTTRCINVQNRLSVAFNKPLNKSVNPDEAVSLGAAKQANIIVGGDGSADMLLLDVTPVNMGLETLGGIFTTIVEENTTIPCTKSQIFSTAVDNQDAVTIHVLQGSRPMAKDCKTIGMFTLDGIAPARKGIPQIEVSFTIDADGIINVKAIDKATNKEQQITIKDGSLSKDEIERIKAEAEQFKAEDEKKKKEIEEINAAEGYIYSVEQSLEDEKFKELITEDESKELKELIEKANDAIKARDTEAIKTAQKDIEDKFNPIVAKLYQQQAAEGGNANPFANMGANPFKDVNFTNAGGDTTQENDSNEPTDVDFEEVK